MKIYDNVAQIIGKTPLVRLSKIEKKYCPNIKLIAKLERANPGGSAKDRIAKYIIEQLEAEGKLRPGSVIIEPTSGNTGIGIALIAAVKGYRAIIIMPSTMSQERISLMKAYGADVRLTDGSLGMQGAIDEANRLNSQIPDSFILGQFENLDNPKAHELTTGPEIFEDTDGSIDILVSAFGTGGTVSGAGAYLKGKKKDIKVIGAEPKGSPMLTEGKAGAHKIQGIGAGFIPKTLDRDIIDQIAVVSDEDAYKFSRLLATEEGILSGISSGAALCAAIEAGCKPENFGKTLVVILPDTGERYLSCEGFIV